MCVWRGGGGQWPELAPGASFCLMGAGGAGKGPLSTRRDTHMVLVEESLLKERATPCGQRRQECRIQASSGVSLPGLQGMEKVSDAASLWGPCRDLASRPPSPAHPASCCAEAMGSWRAGELLTGSPCRRAGVLPGQRREWRVSPAARLSAA